MKYRRFEETLYNKHIGKYNTYGIADSDGQPILRDISVDKSFVDDIVYLFNKYGASFIHVHDIIEDMLM